VLRNFQLLFFCIYLLVYTLVKTWKNLKEVIFVLRKIFSHKKSSFWKICRDNEQKPLHLLLRDIKITKQDAKYLSELSHVFFSLFPGPSSANCDVGRFAMKIYSYTEVQNPFAEVNEPFYFFYVEDVYSMLIKF